MIKTTLYIKNITIRQIKNVFPFRESSLSLDFLRLWWTPQDKYEYFCAAYFKHNHANIIYVYILDYLMQSITKRSDKAWNVASRSGFLPSSKCLVGVVVELKKKYKYEICSAEWKTAFQFFVLNIVCIFLSAWCFCNPIIFMFHHTLLDTHVCLHKWQGLIY